MVAGPSHTEKISASGPNSLITCRQAPQGAVGSAVGVNTTTAWITSGSGGASHGLKDRVALGADRQAVRCVFDVAARKDLTTVGQDGRTDVKAAVGTIGPRCRGCAAAATSCARTGSAMAMARFPTGKTTG